MTSAAGEPPITAARVRERLAEVRQRVRAAGGDTDAVRIVAVTKAFGAAAPRAALAAGLHDLGENYAQELLAKCAELEEQAGSAEPFPGGAPVWHFLGRLQTNKVRALAPVVGLWQSVDRPALAHEIAKRAPGASVLVQINLSGEEQKGGCAFAEAGTLVHAARADGLVVRGLMGVGPAGPAEDARTGFRRLVALADELDLPERSIGMSNDLEVAVEEGSTMIRIGRGLFGDRPLRSA